MTDFRGRLFIGCHNMAVVNCVFCETALSPQVGFGEAMAIP